MFSYGISSVQFVIVGVSVSDPMVITWVSLDAAQLRDENYSDRIVQDGSTHVDAGSDQQHQVGDSVADLRSLHAAVEGEVEHSRTFILQKNKTSDTQFFSSHRTLSH